MNELEAKIEQNRRDQEKLKEEENKLLKEKEEKSRTFEIGQWFNSGDGLHMLAQVGFGQYCLISKDGNRWREPISCGHDVSWANLKQMYQYDLTPVNVKIRVTD